MGNNINININLEEIKNKFEFKPDLRIKKGIESPVKAETRKIIQPKHFLTSDVLINDLPINFIPLSRLCDKYFLLDLNDKDEFRKIRDEILIPRIVNPTRKEALISFWDELYTENSIAENDSKLKFTLSLFSKINYQNLNEDISYFIEILKGQSGLINNNNEISINSLLELLEIYLDNITIILDRSYEKYCLLEWDKYDKKRFSKDSVYKREYLNSHILVNFEKPIKLDDFLRSRLGHLQDYVRVRNEYALFSFEYNKKKKATYYSERNSKFERYYHPNDDKRKIDINNVGKYYKPKNSEKDVRSIMDINHKNSLFNKTENLTIDSNIACDFEFIENESTCNSQKIINYDEIYDDEKKEEDQKSEGENNDE